MKFWAKFCRSIAYDASPQRSTSTHSTAVGLDPFQNYSPKNLSSLRMSIALSVVDYASTTGIKSTPCTLSRHDEKEALQYAICMNVTGRKEGAVEGRCPVTDVE